jgi:hypothetical protein
MQKHMLQLGVVLIVALITMRIGVRGPLASAWRGGSNRRPNRACRLPATLVIVLCVSTVAQALAARCQVPSKAYPTIQTAVDRATCTTINVAAGTYSEPVVTARDVMIRGAGRERTVLDSTGVTIASGMVTIKGVTIQHGTGIANSGTLTVEDSTIAGNGAFAGGGIANIGGTLTVRNSTILGNSASYGGGICDYGGGTITVENSAITGNSASHSGGGIDGRDSTITVEDSTIADNGAFAGGGIANDGGTLTVENSTVAGNDAYGGGGIASYGGTLTVENSTVAGNRALGGSGGGIVNSGMLTVENSTFSGNSAADDGGGIFNFTGGMVTLMDVTFENNIPNDCTGCPGLL